MSIEFIDRSLLEFFAQAEEAKAIAQMETEGPPPSGRVVRTGLVYDDLDFRLMSTMDAEGPTGGSGIGKRVLDEAISAANVSAGVIAEQHGPRIPGTNGNGTSPGTR